MTDDRPNSDIGRPQADREELDHLWLALEEGRLSDALEYSSRLQAAYPEDGEVALARSAVAYESGQVRSTLDFAKLAGELGTEDPLLQRWYVAAAYHYLWQFDEARDLLDNLLREEAEFAEAWYLLAQVCEMQGDQVGARRGYDRARAIQPERFHRPTAISEEQMHEAVGKAREDLRPEFQRALDEVALIVEPQPNWELAKSESPSGDPLPPDLLGLFVGANRLDSSVFDPIEQPGVIFLFQHNLERVCAHPEVLIEEIRTTLYHELAHYLGFEEEDMASLGLE